VTALLEDHNVFHNLLAEATWLQNSTVACIKIQLNRGDICKWFRVRRLENSFEACQKLFCCLL